MRLKSVAAAATSALVLALTACGGGGGTGSGETITASPPPPPPPPPPPENTAPDVIYALSSQNPDEEQPFWIDASGSTDADGDTLTINVTQVSGPAPSDVPLFEDLPAGPGIFAFRAPEVDTDTVMEFEIAVSDGEDTSTETVSVSVTNIELSPLVTISTDDVAAFEELANPTGADFISQSFGAMETGLVGVADSEDASGRRLFRYTNDLMTETFNSVAFTDLPDSVVSEKAVVGDEYFDAFSQTLVIALEQSNQVQLLQAHEQVLSTQSPCAVAAIASPENISLSDLVVGGRDNGLRLFKFDPANGMSIEASTVLEATGEYCYVEGNGDDLVAYDPSTQSLRFWSVQFGAAPLEGPSLPIAQPVGLDLVGAAFQLNASGAGTFAAAFVFSDGARDGHHEVHTSANSLSAPDVVSTKTYTWEKGVPTDIVLDDTDMDDAPTQSDVLIAMEDVPYLIFLKDEQDSMLGTYSPDYGELKYMPAPFWTSNVRHSNGLDLASDNLVLTQTRTGKVSMVKLAPQTP